LILNRILAKNSKAFKYEKILESEYVELKKYFKNDINKLSTLIKKDLNNLWS